jgi:hypothetical protein
MMVIPQRMPGGLDEYKMLVRGPDPACPRCGENALVFVGKVDWVAWAKKQRLRDQT